jgi:DNA-binding response OmpR family regulator
MDRGNAMNKRRILIVDDDADLRRTLSEQLSHYREFELEEAETAEAALARVRAVQVDLMLLDVGLPDMDGREAAKMLRRDGFKSPIIMLTGHDSDSDEILGLESGANDYVTKPFRFSVLLARLRAALRQHDQSEDVVFTIGPYSFHPAQKLLEGGEGTKVRLTDKETSILKFLYRQGPKTIGRDVLLKEVWGYNNRVTTHTLETHIYRLRQKIERDPSNARLLVTEEGGYRLVP